MISKCYYLFQDESEKAYYVRWIPAGVIADPEWYMESWEGNWDEPGPGKRFGHKTFIIATCADTSGNDMKHIKKLRVSTEKDNPSARKRMTDSFANRCIVHCTVWVPEKDFSYAKAHPWGLKITDPIIEFKLAYGWRMEHSNFED